MGALRVIALDVDTCVLLHGDALEELRVLPAGAVDAVVTDPPYELGFMGKRWDATGIAYSVPLWAEVLRVLRPGGHLLACGATRTNHRMKCAIEDAGFEIRDELPWLYGSGFPKSQDAAREYDMHLCTLPGRHADKHLPKKAQAGDHLCPAAPGRERWVGVRTALKGGHEPVVLARKPLEGTLIENLMQHGTGGLYVDACRLPTRENAGRKASGGKGKNALGTSVTYDSAAHPGGRWPANVLLDETAAAELDEQSGHLKSGAMPAGQKRRGRAGVAYGVMDGDTTTTTHADEGGASRFFYVAKPSRAERDAGCATLEPKSGGEATDREDDSLGTQNPRAGAGRNGGARNFHPTVKPLGLMRYLITLVTPPGGIVLDPFAGSGTTGAAALSAGFRFLGVEKSAEYLPITLARLQHALTQDPRG